MSSLFNSKEKFKLISEQSHYLRVDDSHPLELRIGLNDNGQKTIRFIGIFDKVKIRGTRAIEINHYIDNYTKDLILSFSLIEDKFTDLFYLFCNDLVDSSRSIEQEMGYAFLINRFEKWRGFGGSNHKYLSEKQIKGLMGELLFLKDKLFDKYGITKSINGWTGPEATKKDFSYENSWYEIKTATNNLISISSLEQLESDLVGKLVVYHLEKMSPESHGYTINSIVDSILDQIEYHYDKALFIVKLMNVGYYKEEYYDSYVYRNLRTDYFEVTSDFPIIRQKSLPNEILNVKYDIIINVLERFRRDEI